MLLKHQYGHLLSGPEMAYVQQTLEKHSTLFGVKFLQNVKKGYGFCVRISFSFLSDRENLREFKFVTEIDHQHTFFEREEIRM